MMHLWFIFIRWSKMEDKHKELLKKIMSDKYAAGPFSGMIFNAAASTNLPIDVLIEQALFVRLRLEELIK